MYWNIILYTYYVYETEWLNDSLSVHRSRSDIENDKKKKKIKTTTFQQMKQNNKIIFAHVTSTTKKKMRSRVVTE